MANYDAPEEYDQPVRRLVDAINGIEDAGVQTVTPTVGRTTIDFYLGRSGDLSPMQAAQGGRFGSSVVVDTANDEVITATLRYGSLGLPEETDLAIASQEVMKRVEQSDPPLEPGVIDADAPIHIRWRDLAAIDIGPGLSSEGQDILHVVVNDRVSVAAFADWLPRFTRLYRREQDDIREFVLEVGYDG